MVYVPNSTVAETLPQDWSYVSEGGASIVFSYVGPSHSHFDGKVLRLRKTSLDPSHVDAQPDEDQIEDPMIDFQHNVVARLIPPNFLPRLESIGVDRLWLQDITTLHDQERPPGRREKDRINLNRKNAILASDLVGKESLVVEIKVCLH